MKLPKSKLKTVGGADTIGKADTKRKKAGDIPLLICVFLMACFGCLMIYSASSYTAEVQYGDKLYFVKKQIIGVVLGIFTDIFVNPVLHYFESEKREYDKYMMFPFPFKALWTFFANIFYYVVVMVGVNMCYLGINELINYIRSTPGHIPVAVEPLLFGVFCVIVDMIFIGIKDGIVALVRHLRKGKKEAAINV